MARCPVMYSVPQYQLTGHERQVERLALHACLFQATCHVINAMHHEDFVAVSAPLIKSKL